MRKIMEEDPTIKVHEDPDTGQVILAGMGELHLEIVLDRFKTTFGVDINVGKPQVLYCATIDKPSQTEKVFDKLIGETRTTVSVELSIRPNKRGIGNTFHLSIRHLNDGMKGNVMDGLEEACLADPMFGYEVVDIDVHVDKVDLSDKTTGQGLKIASQMALQDAIKKSGVVQLEPIMELDALSSGRLCGGCGGRSQRPVRRASRVSLPRENIIRSRHMCRSSNTFGYSTVLRSLTRGRGSFSMRFSGFDKV